MDYEQILYSVEGPILTITLSRPERLNAFTGQMCRELLDAFDRAGADDSVRVVIVTGAGRAFCAGADLGSGDEAFDSPARRREESIAEHRDGGGLLTLRIYDSKKPRQLLWKMLGADHPMEAHRIDSKAVFWMGRSVDAYEGVRAFFEKRPAKFTLKPSEMPEFHPWWTPRRWGRDGG